MSKGVSRLYSWASGLKLVLAIIGTGISIVALSYFTDTLVYSVYGYARLPDLMFGYTVDDVQGFFETLGQDGLYLWLQVHLIDYIFPLMYGLALVIGLALVLQRLRPNEPSWQYTLWTPIIGVIADFIENTLIALLILSYPPINTAIVSIASSITMIKWSFLVISFLLFIVIPLKTVISTKRLQPQ